MNMKTYKKSDTGVFERNGLWDVVIEGDVIVSYKDKQRAEADLLESMIAIGEWSE